MMIPLLIFMFVVLRFFAVVIVYRLISNGTHFEICVNEIAILVFALTTLWSSGRRKYELEPVAVTGRGLESLLTM